MPLTVVPVFAWALLWLAGSRDSSLIAIGAAVAFFFLHMAASPYHARQAEKMKRSKAILDRFNPERSKHPLGL
jgi:hypothetical protein